SEMLGVPVIAVSSKTSEGVDALADAVCEGKARVSNLKIEYDPMIEKAIDAISDVLEDTRFSVRGCAVKMMENSHEFNTHADDQVVRSAGMLRKLYSEENGQSMAISIASSRYAESKRMVEACVSERDVEPSLSEKISDLTITPVTGVPILIGVCLLIVLAIVELGSFLDGVVNGAYDALIGTSLIDFGMGFGDFWGAVFTGVDGSIRAILSLVIPYIMVFYIILGILEDSGYLTRAVVLLDKVMHHFGLHGGAFIPMIVGIGCNVPAIMAVRTVKSRREKIILSCMIVMAVPCSAQIAIIMGATGAYSGFIYAVMIFGILVLIGCLTGIVLNRFMKYEPSNLAMELPDLAVPSVKNVLSKMWNRVKDFFYVAFPLLVVGSVALEVLLQYDLLRYVVDPLSPITVGMLGLPAVCSIAFLVGILRKEMALGMLVILAGGVPLAEFLTPDQFVVFGTVMAIYMPCVATLVTMWHEIGWKETVAVSLVSITIAILAGTGVRIMLGLF
ncbi:MAG: nucleoside recognition domain-containing protein, partial [Candidatus Methanomethylophilaceae archaeon]